MFVLFLFLFLLVVVVVVVICQTTSQTILRRLYASSHVVQGRDRARVNKK
jgi:hypothetical protein